LFDTENEIAATPPNVTAVVPVKLLPLKLTRVPPASEPDVPLTDEIVGTAGAAVYVKALGRLALPPAVVIERNAEPVDPPVEGVVNVICVELTTLY
jgi:hypothetical protein